MSHQKTIHPQFKPNNCAHCGVRLEPGVTLFCRTHWFQLPAKERQAIVNMTARAQNVDTKLAKCVRILREQKTAAHVVPAQPDPLRVL